MKIIIKENKQLLKEIKMEQVLPRFESPKFAKAIERFGEISVADMKQQIIEIIPKDIEEKYKPEALNWLITAIINPNAKYSPRTTKSDLETFYQIKEQKLERFLSKSDINSISDPAELKQITDSAKKLWDIHNSKNINPRKAKEGIKLIFENAEWRIYIPENHDASCYLGSGTDWCTSKKGQTYYYTYHSKENPLLIFISKINKVPMTNLVNGKEVVTEMPYKVQFNYLNGEYKDYQDNNIDKSKKFYKLNELIKLLDNKLPKAVINIANLYNYEELPNGGYHIKMDREYENYYDRDGLLHREDGPAKINYYSNGQIKQEIWFENNTISKKDGPAIIAYFQNGNLKEQKWLEHGRLYRNGDDEPAIITYYLNGKKEQEAWFISSENPNKIFYRGCLNREFGAAEIDYYFSGRIRRKTYAKNGEIIKIRLYKDEEGSPEIKDIEAGLE